jgi:hypothetical protein
MPYVYVEARPRGRPDGLQRALTEDHADHLLATRLRPAGRASASFERQGVTFPVEPGPKRFRLIADGGLVFC